MTMTRVPGKRTNASMILRSLLSLRMQRIAMGMEKITKSQTRERAEFVT